MCNGYAVFKKRIDRLINSHMEKLQRHIKEDTINLRVSRRLKNRVIRHCNETEQTMTNTIIQAIQKVLKEDTPNET